MERNEADMEMNAVALINDAIDKICELLEPRDLFSVAQVCKTWYEAARREKCKRLGIKLFRLPYEFKNLAFKLDANRAVALLICNSQFGISKDDGLEDVLETKNRVMALLREKRIRKTLILLMDDHLTTEEGTFCGARHQAKLLAYLFTNLERRSQVRVASIEKFIEMDDEIDDLGKELGFDDYEYRKSTLLLFFRGRRNLHADMVVKKFQNRFHCNVQSGEKMTWICIFVKNLVLSNDSRNDRSMSRKNFAAVRISGPSIESWATFIYCLAQKDVIERKLQILKEKVKLKRYNAGLVYSPKCVEEGCSHDKHVCCNWHEIMRYVNRFFPTVPFVGLFADASLRILTVENNCYGPGDGYFLFLYTSIIIISYD